eukprot:6187066-Pleurochrysis_carterae.AAC.6
MSGTDIAQSPERRDVGARQLTLVLKIDSWLAFAPGTAMRIRCHVEDNFRRIRQFVVYQYVDEICISSTVHTSYGGVNPPYQHASRTRAVGIAIACARNMHWYHYGY